MCSHSLMEKAILFAVLASFCTATASVCQRIGARSSETAGFDLWLVFRLARQPIWLLGVGSMIGGFLFQLVALHFGALALVQPILAVELLLVFGYMAVAGGGPGAGAPPGLAGRGGHVRRDSAVPGAGVPVRRAAERAGARMDARRLDHARPGPGAAGHGVRPRRPPCRDPVQARRPARLRHWHLLGLRGGGHQGA